MFSIKLYQSEFSIFINDFWQKHPLEIQQRDFLVRTWWENPLTAEEQEDFLSSEIPSQVYPYQVD